MELAIVCGAESEGRWSHQELCVQRRSVGYSVAWDVGLGRRDAGPSKSLGGWAGRVAESCGMATDRDDKPNEPEDVPMATTAEVAAVVQGVHRRRRGQVRWSLGRHTAEMALRALEEPPRPRRRPSSSKNRRRKRHKRML